MPNLPNNVVLSEMNGADLSPKELAYLAKHAMSLGDHMELDRLKDEYFNAHPPAWALAL